MPGERNLQKYVIRDNRLFNTETEEFVPDDIPAFVLLATDCSAPHAIYKYAQKCDNAKHKQGVEQIATEFNMWQLQNPDRVHEPDGRI